MKKLLCWLVVIVTSLSGVSQSIEEKAHELMNAYVQNGRFNGSVLMAKGDVMLFQRGYGYRNDSTKIRNNVNTIFQTGSITKQFTTAVILQLEKERKLSVKDKLSKYFPDFPRGNDITLENMMQHTSGIYSYTNDRDFMSTKVEIPHSDEQMIALFRDKPLDFEPGSQWSYSNSAYVLLGFIIEKVTGKPYERVVRERILQPLQMTRSGFDFTHLNSKDKSTGYFTSGNNKRPAPIVDSTVAYSAGALYSTVIDLYKWDRAIYTSRILSQDDWKRAFTPNLNKYGYGWAIDTLYGRRFTAHGGGIHGYSSYILRFPDDKAVVIILDNTGSPQLDNIARGLAAIMFNAPYKVPEIVKEIHVPVTTLQQYVGKYELTPQFVVTVRLDNGVLKAKPTNQDELQLFAERDDLFFLKVIEAKVRFVKNDRGEVDKMILYQNGQEMSGKKIE